MNAQTPIKKSVSSPSESYARHQKQRFWQIIVPVGLGVLLILVILALVILSAVRSDAGGPVSQWADASMIWLSMHALLFALVFTVILFGLVFVMANLLNVLPKYTLPLQQYAKLISGGIISGADKLVAPIIAIKSFGARASATMDALLGRRRD